MNKVPSAYLASREEPLPSTLEWTLLRTSWLIFIMNLVVLSEISAKDLTRTSCINEAIQLFEYALVGVRGFLGRGPRVFRPAINQRKALSFHLRRGVKFTLKNAHR